MASTTLLSRALARAGPSVPAAPSLFTRTVVHHARPPRRPRKAGPLDAQPASPSPGTSRPSPKGSSQPKSSSQEGSPRSVTFTTTPPASASSSSVGGAPTELELHYAPAPSAPSYTTGRVPELLRWVSGAKDVRASAQANAGLLRPTRAAAGKAPEQGGAQRLEESLGEGVVGEMRKLREEDPTRWTRSALMRRFNIPSTLSAHLARLAPAPPAHRDVLAARLERRKAGWGWRKTLAREVREQRRAYW